MDRSDVIRLISVTYTTDEIGQEVAAEAGREVYCSVASITRAEWYDAAMVQLKPEYKVTMFAPDYEGEQTAEYDGVRYGVFRTYRGQNETLELYLERKAGV